MSEYKWSREASEASESPMELLRGRVDRVLNGESDSLDVKGLLRSTGEAGRDFLLAALQRMPNLRSFDFSENGLNTGWLEEYCATIGRLKSLRSLKLHSMQVTPRRAVYAARMLSELPRLEELDLSNNELGAGGYFELAPALGRLRSLKTLNLRRSLMDSVAAEQLAPSLAQLPTLSSLDLGTNDIGGEGLTALRPALGRLMSLTSLSLSDAAIDSNSCDPLATILCSLPALQELDLSTFSVFGLSLNVSANRLNANSCEWLARGIGTLPNLNYLNFCGNEITSAGLKHLTGAIRGKKKFEVLWLNRCGIDDDGCRELAQTAAELPGLSRLSLGGNFIGGEGCKYLAEVCRQCPSLRTLSLSDSGFSDDGCLLLAEGLKSASALEKLHLEECGISVAGAQGLALALPQLRCLRELNLADNPLGDSGAIVILKAVENSPNLEDLRLSKASLTGDSLPTIHQVVSGLSKLQVIRLDGNNFPEPNCGALFGQLRQSPALKDVDLTPRTNSGASAQERLKQFTADNLARRQKPDRRASDAETLASIRSQKLLDLSDRRIDDQLAPAVAERLTGNPVEYLTLSYTTLTDTGLNLLSDSIASLDFLTYLRLDHNLLTHRSGTTLQGILNRLPHPLFELDLGTNKLGDRGVIALAQARPLASIGVLDLNYNQVGDDGCKALAQCLAECERMIALNLSFNLISDAGCIALARVLASHPDLEELNLCWNMIEDVGLRELVCSLEDHPSLQRIDFCGNPVSVPEPILATKDLTTILNYLNTT